MQPVDSFLEDITMINISKKNNRIYIVLGLIIIFCCTFIFFKNLNTKSNIVKLNKIETLYLIQSDLQQSNYLTALRLIKKSLKDSPNDPDLLFKLAMVYYSTGCYDETEKILKGLINKDKFYGDAYIILGQIYTQKHSYSEAIKIYESLLANMEGSANLDDIYNILIEACLKSNDSNKVSFFISKALSINNNNPTALAYQGIIISKKDYKKAFNILSHADKVNNKIYPVQIGLSDLYIKNKQYDKSLKVLNRAKILFPNNAKIYFLLAQIHNKKKDSLKTIYHLVKSVELDQRDMTKDDYNEIVSLSEKLLKVSDSNKLLYEVIAAAYIRLNDYKKAIATYLEAIKKNLESAEIHNNLAGIYLQISPKESIKEYLKAVKQDPKNFIYYYGLANAYKKDGNIEKSIEYTNKTLQLKPNFALAEVNLGDSYKSILKYQDATLHYRKALKLNYSEAFAYKGLGNIFYEKKIYDQAIWNFENFLKFSNDYQENAIVLKKSEQIISFLDKN